MAVANGQIITIYVSMCVSILSGHFRCDDGAKQQRESCEEIRVMRESSSRSFLLVVARRTPKVSDKRGDILLTLIVLLFYFIFSDNGSWGVSTSMFSRLTNYMRTNVEASANKLKERKKESEKEKRMGDYGEMFLLLRLTSPVTFGVE